jgi:5-methylcytosine-specific restriction endonuclease McrA
MSTAAAQSPVLFLDADMTPLRVETWQRAFCDLVLGKVQVIEYSRDRTIRGIGRDYPMPSVVRVVRRFRRDRARVKFSRINIYARDRFVCQYDGRRYASEDLTFDHVLPRSRGGRTTWDNIVTCCVPCNSEKGDRTPEEAAMPLLSRPRKPRYVPAITVAMDPARMPEEWRGYWSDCLDG